MNLKEHILVFCELLGRAGKEGAFDSVSPPGPLVMLHRDQTEEQTFATHLCLDLFDKCLVGPVGYCSIAPSSCIRVDEELRLIGILFDHFVHVEALQVPDGVQLGRMIFFLNVHVPLPSSILVRKDATSFVLELAHQVPNIIVYDVYGARVVPVAHVLEPFVGLGIDEEHERCAAHARQEVVEPSVVLVCRVFALELEVDGDHRGRTELEFARHDDFLLEGARVRHRAGKSEPFLIRRRLRRCSCGIGRNGGERGGEMI